MSEVYSCRDPERRAAGFAAAKRTLEGSGLIVLPTDTVYGIAADAFDPEGVRRLLRAKARGRGMPPPVLVGDLDTMQALTDEDGADVQKLVDAFWPGGLTLVVRQQASLRWDLGDTRGTVALRMPDQADTVALLKQTGPLAVSSANISGQPASTTVEEAQEMLSDSVDVFLDAGPTPGPVASTIIDATGDTLRVLRAGVVTLAELRKVVPEIEGTSTDVDDAEPDDAASDNAEPDNAESDNAESDA